MNVHRNYPQYVVFYRKLFYSKNNWIIVEKRLQNKWRVGEMGKEREEWNKKEKKKHYGPIALISELTYGATRGK